jgi:hypothetical protein
MEGFTSFELGARGAHLGEVVTLDGTPMGAASIMFRVCLLSGKAKAVKLSSHVKMVPSRLSSSLSWARSWSCSSAITTEEGTNEGTKALHQSTSKG